MKLNLILNLVLAKADDIVGPVSHELVEKNTVHLKAGAKGAQRPHRALRGELRAARGDRGERFCFHCTFGEVAPPGSPGLFRISLVGFPGEGANGVQKFTGEFVSSGSLG